MDKIIDGYVEQFNIKISQFKDNINKRIESTCNKLIENKEKIEKIEIINWKIELINYINYEMTKSVYWSYNPEINFDINLNNQKVIEIEEKAQEIIIENTNELNGFTSKDIQDENKEITRYIQEEAYNYMGSEEEKENENVGKFLLDVGKTSRFSYNASQSLYIDIEKKYKEFKKSEIDLSDKENFLEFSTWVKNLEKANKNYFDSILNKDKFYGDKEMQDSKNFFPKLFRDLSRMYFHCQLSSPRVEINFNKQTDFISEKMIDFINRGKNRKVNFVILPSLCSYGNPLENGKSWVFTYIDNTFKFEEESINKYLESLN